MYKVEVTKIDKVEKVVKGEWAVLEKRPYTKEECDEAGYGENFKAELKSIYGYAEPQKQMVETEVKVLSQTVEGLDLIEVIKAINGIGAKDA